MTASDSSQPSTNPASTRLVSTRLARSILVVAALLALVGGAGIAVAGIMRDGSLGGILGSVFGGIVLALAIMGAAAWLAMSLMKGPKIPDTVGGEAIAADLKDVLAEVERTRLETVEAINKRAMWRVPLCVLGGIALLILMQMQPDNEPLDIFDMMMVVAVAGAVGYVWASSGLSASYTRLYKDKVLPRLAATFGDLNYRDAKVPDLGVLKEENIFRNFDALEADDEIYGTYRNLPLNIVELKLTHGSGDDKETTFSGLLVTLDLPRDTGATTAVISDAGVLGNFVDRQKARHRERVKLEDVVFEKVYEVYGSDQIAARALLNPAFMERLLKLAQLPGFGVPLILCAGRVLHIAMPRTGLNLFEPPGFRKPAATHEALVALRKDIAAVLAAADAVIDLDHRFEIAQRQ
jgi:hypothetical protein